MEADLPKDHGVDRAGPQQGDGHQGGAHHLGQDGGQGRPEHVQVEAHHEEQVQHDVGQARGHEEVEGTAGIAHGPEDAGPHVVDKGGDGAAEIDPQIGEGVAHHVLGGTHEAQDGAGEENAHDVDDDAGGQGQGDARMNGLPQLLTLAGAVVLGDDHGGAGGEAHEEVHQEVDDDRRGAAHGAQGGGAHEVAHDDGVHRVVELLEKGAQQDGKEEGEERLEDGPLGDLILHGCAPSLSVFRERRRKRPPPGGAAGWGLDNYSRFWPLMSRRKASWKNSAAFRHRSIRWRKISK